MQTVDIKFVAQLHVGQAEKIIKYSASPTFVSGYVFVYVGFVCHRLTTNIMLCSTLVYPLGILILITVLVCYQSFLNLAYCELN